MASIIKNGILFQKTSNGLEIYGDEWTMKFTNEALDKCSIRENGFGGVDVRYFRDNCLEVWNEGLVANTG